MALQYHPLPLEVFNEKARPYIARHNAELRNIFGLEGCLREEREVNRSDRSIARGELTQVHTTRITPSISEVVSGISTAVGTPSLTLGTGNVVGSTTTAISINSTIAFFDTTAPSALGSTAATGSVAFGARRDHQHIYPPVLLSTANAATLTLTDDATDQTLTGSLGRLIIATGDDTLTLPSRIGLGQAPFPDSGAGFQIRTAVSGTNMRSGLEGGISVDDGGTYVSATFYGGLLRVTPSNGTTFTTCSTRVLELQHVAVNHSSGTHSFTNRDALFLNSAVVPIQSGTGVVTTTTAARIRSSAWLIIGNPGTLTNAYECLLNMPTGGSTIRRGVHLTTATNNVGTEATNVEGFYCEDITRGTGQRASFYAEGHANGTPSNVYAFIQGTAHVVGSTRVGFKSAGATTGSPTLCVGFYADAHTVGSSKYSFYGVSDVLYQGGNAEVIGTLGVTGLATFGNTALVHGSIGVTGWATLGSTVTLHSTIGVTGNAVFGNSLSVAGTFKHSGSLAGIFGATPSTQYGTTGTEAGFTAGASTTVTEDSTFTGNTGSKAYTIGDLVFAMKRLGALAY